MVNTKIYIHYGATRFIEEYWEPIQNQNWIKPHGGLWASAVDAQYGWKDWNENSDYQACDEMNSFKFKLKPEAKLLVIDSVNALKRLHKLQYTVTTLVRDVYFLNFERLLEDGYDAIDFQLSKDRELYWSMYGWDCDSILVMNKDVIEEI